MQSGRTDQFLRTFDLEQYRSDECIAQISNIRDPRAVPTTGPSGHVHQAVRRHLQQADNQYRRELPTAESEDTTSCWLRMPRYTASCFPVLMHGVSEVNVEHGGDCWDDPGGEGRPRRWPAARLKKPLWILALSRLPVCGTPIHTLDMATGFSLLDQADEGETGC